MLTYKGRAISDMYYFEIILLRAKLVELHSEGKISDYKYKQYSEIMKFWYDQKVDDVQS